MNILIVGATGGIGQSLSRELSKKHNLFLGSRKMEKINHLVNDLNSNDYLVGGDTIDVCIYESIESFIDEGNKFLGSIDCIINCAGSLLLKPIHLSTQEEIENVFKTNLFGCFGLLKYGFKYLRKDGGSVILFSSAASKVGLKNHDCISSAKSGVSSFALSAASTYARYNIRINAIAPGLVDTPLTSKIVNNKINLDYSKNLHGLNRIGSPENFIPIVNSLIDQRSDWITGQTIFVDGGLSNIKQ